MLFGLTKVTYCAGDSDTPSNLVLFITEKTEIVVVTEG